MAFGGGTSTTCGQPLVECYDAGSANGILLARGYSMAGSGAQPSAPLARNVYLTPGTCPDPYFHDESASCTIGVHAEVDFGPCSQLSAVGPKLTARVGGSSYPMTLAGCPSGSSTSVWETNGAPATIGPEAGPVSVWLDWEETKGTQGGNTCKSTGGNNCKGSFGSATAPLARSFAASSSRTGPIHFAQLWEGGSGWANSFERCSAVQPSCTHDLVAKIGIQQNLQDNADSVDDPIVELRFGAASGSQNQALDCDPAMLESHGTRSPPDARRSTSDNRARRVQAPRTALWASASALGLRRRGDGRQDRPDHQGDEPANPWRREPCRAASAPTTGPASPTSTQDDPRIVPVFITPFGTFQSTAGERAVTGFAVFYVTGWDGPSQPCHHGRSGAFKSIVGHFIKYVETLRRGCRGGALRLRRAGLLCGGADQIEKQRRENHANQHAELTTKKKDRSGRSSSDAAAPSPPAAVAAVAALGSARVHEQLPRQRAPGADEVDRPGRQPAPIDKGTSGDVIAEAGLFSSTKVSEVDASEGAFADPSALRGQVAARGHLRGRAAHSRQLRFRRRPDRRRSSRATQRALSIPVDEAEGNVGQLDAGSRIDVLGGFNAEQTGGRTRPIMDVLARRTCSS